MAEAFNTDDMELIGAAMQEAYTSTLSQYGPSYTGEIQEFVINLLTREKYHAWTTLEGMKRIQEVVFGTELNYDFVLSLQFHFFSRWGQGPQKYDSLVSVLAQSISYEQRDEGISLIPKEIQDRLSNTQDAELILRNNKWMVTLLVFKLFIVFDIKTKPSRSRGQDNDAQQQQ